MAQLDMHDKQIRRMVDIHHTPTEEWSVAGTLMSVHCDQCGHDWPCPTRNALNEYLERNLP